MDTADEKNDDFPEAGSRDVRTLRELFRLQLRTALAMEYDSLAGLAELRAAGTPHDTTDLLGHHANETREQIENLNRIFAAIGEEPLPEPSAASAGIRRQGRDLVEDCAQEMRERAVLAAALGSESYEIGCYQGLITLAEELDAGDAAELLQLNLAQEVHTGEALRRRLQVVG
ncbi:ferritin-like domain-containing protein [Microbacterium sp. NPDC057659]|uniref:YciE/YciF ferroxidase family protein n=1 Tax=Microbacterium sp. NPDC057659 TaxID=3346198 RepID=UPI0036733D86